MANIMILGCGFGTALGIMWDKYGHNVTAWSKYEEEIEAIRKDGEHKRLLPGVIVPPTITLTTDLSVASGVDILVFAIPSKFVREVAQSVKPYVTPNTVIVNVGKGFEEETEKRLSEVLKEELPNNSVVVLTGPSHAEEVARNFPTTVVCASDDKASTEYVQDTLQNNRFRIYANSDIIGCEIGGAMKNAIALCCGIIEGMGLGDNTLAAIMTRGIAEITRMGVAMGAKRETFNGLSGIGDLIVTCTSTHSRNHRAGLLIGEGMSAEDAVARVGTVEGYNVAKIAQKIAKRLGVSVPIIDQLCVVCYEGQNPFASISKLMTRPSRAEEEVF
ncbi:MAG: NAD(P)-dependent glycerol-3-phosphate dehydrogenase [Ruminococcaceae bacterium]|nr:NAD(P)-dependent glycerol-3-phosphate dehydrogenase [Oscillospiraceae bacterium]